MIGEIIGGILVLNALSKIGDTHVKHGKDVFGSKYKKTSGICYRCDGSGKVHGKTCRKCGGLGYYSNTTWYD